MSWSDNQFIVAPILIPQYFDEVSLAGLENGEKIHALVSGHPVDCPKFSLLITNRFGLEQLEEKIDQAVREGKIVLFKSVSVAAYSSKQVEATLSAYALDQPRQEVTSYRYGDHHPDEELRIGSLFIQRTAKSLF